MTKKRRNIGIISIVVTGLLIIAVVSFVLLKSNQTIKVWVPAKAMTTGDVLNKDDLKQINIPADTPGNYLNNLDMIEGYKLKNSVEAEQLLYASDFLSSWESYNEDSEVPEDYVVTSIQVPDSRAVGGLIVAGDTIDIMGVSTNGKRIGFEQDSASDINGRENIGTNVYYILSNVKVINTNSSLSKAQKNDMSEVVSKEDSGKGEGNYYVVALSYDDAKKLRQAEGVLDLWLNISPKQNDKNPPLINQMVGQSFSELHDAQKPVQDKDGKMIKDGGKSEKSDKEDKDKK